MGEVGVRVVVGKGGAVITAAALWHDVGLAPVLLGGLYGRWMYG